VGSTNTSGHAGSAQVHKGLGSVEAPALANYSSHSPRRWNRTVMSEKFDKNLFDYFLVCNQLQMVLLISLCWVRYYETKCRML